MQNSWPRRSHLRQQNGTAAVSQRSMKTTGRMWRTTVCRLTHMIKPTQRQRANRAPLTRSLAYLSRHADGDVELRVPFKFLRPQKKRMPSSAVFHSCCTCTALFLASVRRSCICACPALIFNAYRLRRGWADCLQHSLGQAQGAPHDSHDRWPRSEAPEQLQHGRR